MSPATLNLPITRGDDFAQTLRIRTRNEDGTTGPAVDFTGWTATAVTKSRGKEFAFDLVFTDVQDGLITISMPAERTALLPATNGKWSLRLTTPDGKLSETYITGWSYHSTN